MHVCLFVSVFVCMSACMSQKPHVRISRNFLYVLPVTIARSFSSDNAIRNVLPVCDNVVFQIMERMGQNQRRRVCFVQFTRWQQRAKSAISDCVLY